MNTPLDTGVLCRWPVGLPAHSRFGGSRDGFGAPRGDRYSAGVDLVTLDDSLVVSPVAGRVLHKSSWWRGLFGVYLRSGPTVILLAGLSPDSFARFEVQVGQRVDPGRRLGMTTTPSNTSLGAALRVEAYRAGDDTDEEFRARLRAGEFVWWANRPPPERLLDPTAALEQVFFNPSREVDKP